MNLYASTLGGRLKELREARGLLQKELCERIDMTQRNYSKYETDKIVRPVPEVIKKLADFYEVPVEVLMRKDDLLGHIPERILKFIQQPDSLPFLVKAYKEYQDYLEYTKSF